MATRIPLFRRWVPGWLGLVVIFLILLPTLMINGAYMANSIDVASYLGSLSEDINMTFYASTVGMAVTYPIVPKVLPALTTKRALLIGILLQVVLSFICATTEHVEFITICSFFIGILKAFAMMTCLRVLIPIISPKNLRSEFYPVFYPISLTVGQLSMALTAHLAYIYQWQYMYFFMMGLLLLAALSVLLFFKYDRKKVSFRMQDVDWLSMILASVTMLLILYVSTYGKVKDWFSDSGIVLATALIPCLLLWFIRRQLLQPNPYVDLSVCKNRQSYIAYFLMFAMTFFLSTNTLTSAYTTSVLQLDSLHANNLYLWMIVGFLLGAPFCYWWFKQKHSMKVLFLIGFSMLFVTIIYFYFDVHPAGLYADMFLPMVIRGAGMMILFVASGVYAVEGLQQTKYIHNAFFLIGIRSAIAPAICNGFFANWLYRSQQQNIMILGESVNMQNPLAVSRYTSAMQSAIAQGNGVTTAQQLATNSLYNSVQQQATVVSIKYILGICIIVGIIFFIFTAFGVFDERNTSGVKIRLRWPDMV